MSNGAKINQAADEIDAFATTSTRILATSLREMMTLVDPETGTPAVWLDHRLSSARNSGTVRWMGHDLDNGRLVEVTLRSSMKVSVLA